MNKITLNFGIDSGVVGVYFLVDTNNDEVVYVGQSTCIKSRLTQHYRNGKKDFDAFYYQECDKSELNDKEAEAIIELNPKYNESLPLGEVYTSRVKLRESLSRHCYDFAETIEPCYKDNRIKKPTMKDFIDFLDGKELIIDNMLTNGKLKGIKEGK